VASEPRMIVGSFSALRPNTAHDHESRLRVTTLRSELMRKPTALRSRISRERTAKDRAHRERDPARPRKDRAHRERGPGTTTEGPGAPRRTDHHAKDRAHREGPSAATKAGAAPPT
jgi:hypothetical protein